MSFNLETTRLRLRQFQDSDLEPFWAYRNDPEVARYQSWEVPYSQERAQAFIEEMEAKDPAVKGDWFQNVIELKATGEIVGDTAYFLNPDEPQARIGFTIARGHWRKGYGTEAVRRLLTYLFDEVNLHRVTAIADIENIPSYSMLDRLGFRREGHFVENVMFKGNWGSEYYYGMLKREWEFRDR